MLSEYQPGSSILLKQRTSGAERQYKYEGEDMQGRIVGRSGPLRSTFRLFIVVAQPLQKRCPQDFGGDIGPGIRSCESIS